MGSIENIMKRLKNYEKKIVIFLVSFLIFLILSYNRLHNWDECFYLYYAAFKPIETNNPFIAAKYGHLLLLNLIIKFTGTGLNGLFFLDLIYGLMLFLFVILSFMFLKEIMDSRKDAFYATIILMFLPLTIFLSFKTLSEVPALLFGSAGLLTFILGLKKENKIKSLFLSIISGFLLFLATLSRLDVSIIFFSLLPSLIIYKRFRNLFSSVLIVCMTLLSLVSLESVLFKINQFSLPFLISNIEYDPFFHNLFRLIFIGSLFSLFTIISFINYRDKTFRFALVWFIAANIPIFILINYMNIRHYYITLIPFSILGLLGFKESFKILNKRNVDQRFAKIIIVFLFLLILIGNNLYMSKFMENEVDANTYDKIFKKINAVYNDEIILIPYSFADYSFLKFSYPDKKIFTVESIKNSEKEKKHLQELYGNEYIGEMKSLKRLNNNNNTILYISSSEAKYNWSWIVIDPQIELIEIINEVDFKDNKYQVYLVKLQ